MGRNCAGWNVLVGADMENIVKAVADQRVPDKRPLLYGENVCEKIVGIINNGGTFGGHKHFLEIH